MRTESHRYDDEIRFYASFLINDNHTLSITVAARHTRLEILQRQYVGLQGSSRCTLSTICTTALIWRNSEASTSVVTLASQSRLSNVDSDPNRALMTTFGRLNSLHFRTTSLV